MSFGGDGIKTRMLRKKQPKQKELFFAASLCIYFTAGMDPIVGTERIQGDKLNMVVLFSYLGKSDLYIVHLYSTVHWTSHFLQGIRKTRPCLTGHPVHYI